MEAKYPTLTVEERVARLEGALGWSRARVPLLDSMFYGAAVCGPAAVALSFIGLGWSNHYYQLVFAALTVALAYHQGWLAQPAKRLQWSLAALDVLMLAMLYKLVIGSGVVEPFFWLQLPGVETQAAEGAFALLPKTQIVWQKTALAGWAIDLTIVQTFLLLVTLLGALFEFQPFASLTAFLLVLVSLPALVAFDWPWVFPALILAGASFYLQSVESNLQE